LTLAADGLLTARPLPGTLLRTLLGGRRGADARAGPPAPAGAGDRGLLALRLGPGEGGLDAAGRLARPPGTLGASGGAPGPGAHGLTGGRGGGLVGAAARTSTALLADGGHEVRLAHLGAHGDAHAGGELLQLGQTESAERSGLGRSSVG